MRKVQYSDYRPSPISFSFLFDDVITAKRDGVEVQSQMYSPLLGGNPKPKVFGIINKGEQIKGTLVPAFQYETGKWEETTFEMAVYVIQNPVTNMAEHIPFHGYTVLIVKVEDVGWTYAEKEGIRADYIFPPE